MRGRVEPVPAISLLGGACMSYTFSLSRRSLPVRCLCLLLIVLVLWCFFMVPRAGAVALEATTIAYAGLLVGTVLVGAGVAFSSPGDMAAVGNAMYKTLQKGNEAIASKIASLSVWAVEHGKAIGSAALRVGSDLYNAIVDIFNTSVSGSQFPAAISQSFLLTRDNFSSIFVAYNKTRSNFCAFRDSDGVYWTFNLVQKGNVYTYYIQRDGVDYQQVPFDNWLNEPLSIYLSDDKSRVGYFWGFLDGGTMNCVGGFQGTDLYIPGSSFYSPVAIDYSVDVPVPSGSLSYPSDDYLVKMPDIPDVDVGTGAAVYPSDLAYTKDAVSVPYPTDADGVKVPDIPYDKVVDQSTGKTLDDTDTGTDTDRPSKPGEGTDTGSNTGLLQKILDLLKNFFDGPSDFRLNMDGFRNLAIADKFPFCIPFDLVDSIKQFAVSAKDFHFRIKLDTHYFKVDHEVDLSDMVLPFAFFRYMVLVWFVWTLMLRTRDLVKW